MSKHHENKIPILSFFSGGGFMDMGFEQAGFKVVWTNEIDKLSDMLNGNKLSDGKKFKKND